MLRTFLRSLRKKRGWLASALCPLLLLLLCPVPASAGCCFYSVDCATGVYECEIYCDGTFPNCIVYEHCSGSDVTGSDCKTSMLTCAGQYIDCNGPPAYASCNCSQSYDRNTCPPNISQCTSGDCHWDVNYTMHCDTPNLCC